ncbi:UNVERIFIED_CONTAM: hypothetical protein HDU68_003006 [Siphonaria sp. JEL0065]|nr:hypothetical protein HDU68_003006 [Siphonaria sp. JEL0065]
MNPERDPLLSTATAHTSATATSTTSTSSTVSYLKGDGKLYTKTIINTLLLVVIAFLALNEITPIFSTTPTNPNFHGWALPSASIKEIHMDLHGAHWDVTVHKGVYANSLFSVDVESTDWTLQQSTIVFANVDPTKNERVLVRVEFPWWKWFYSPIVKIKLVVNLSSDLAEFKTVGEDVRLVWQSVNVNTSFVVSTKRGSVNLLTPISTKVMDIQVAESGYLGIFNCSVSDRVVLKTGEGDVEAQALVGYKELSVETGMGNVMMGLVPGIQDSKNSIVVSGEGLMTLVVYGFKGRFTVDAPEGAARYSGTDWPLERNNPDVGTVGGKGVGKGTLLARITKRGMATLDFYPNNTTLPSSAVNLFNMH